MFNTWCVITSNGEFAHLYISQKHLTLLLKSNHSANIDVLMLSSVMGNMIMGFRCPKHFSRKCSVKYACVCGKSIRHVEQFINTPKPKAFIINIWWISVLNRFHMHWVFILINTNNSFGSQWIFVCLKWTRASFEPHEMWFATWCSG